MADGDEDKVLEAASKLPLSEQVQHKNWKVRSQAFDKVERTCNGALGDEDPAIADLGSLFVKAVTDTNAAALDKALDALQAYLQKANDKQAARIAEPTCKNLASKQLKQRPGTVKRIGDVCALFTELEQAEGVLAGLFGAFSDKVPKVVVAAVDIVLQLVSSFGTKVVPAKQVLTAMPALFDAKQEPIRDAAKRLTLELAGWIGVDTVKMLVCEKMPEAMRSNMEKLLEDQAGAPRKVASRLTRKQQAVAMTQQQQAGADSSADAGAAAGAPAAAAEQDAEPEGMDPYELAEPVDVVKQLDKAFWEGLAHIKWVERRNALQRLRGITGSPRLAPGDFGDVLRELKKIVNKDSNVVCVGESIGCIGNMAQGLRSSFAGPARQWAGVLLEKLKDKNMAVTANSISALQIFFKYCIALQDVAEDLAAALDHKTPKVKSETLKILQATVEAGSKQAAVKAAPAVLPAIAKAANDAVTDIREAALCLLVAFCLKMGASLPSKVHDQLDDIRKKRLEELIQQARTQGTAPKPGAAGTSAPASTAAVPSLPRPLGPSNTDASCRPPTSRTGAAAKRSAPPSRTTSGAKQAQAAAASSAPAGPADDDDAGLASGSLSKDEAEMALIKLFGEETVKNLKAEQWKFRKEAMEDILGKIEAYQGSNADAHVSECIQGFSFLPGWAEKNFQVYAKALEAIIALVNKTSALAKKPGFVVVTGVVDKLSDGKLKGAGCDALTAISEAISPQFVCTQLHKKAAAHKSPKVLSEALAWMTRTVDEFTLAAFDVTLLLNWAKQDLASTQAPVRNAAVQLLAACHKQLGPGLAPLVQNDVKPAQWTILEEAFAANPQQQVAATRHTRKGSKAAATKGKGAAAAANGVAEESSVSTIASADDLLPRADISGAITATIMTNLTGVKWKDRNTAMGMIEEVLKGAGGRIQPNVGPELLPALKARLQDSNRNLAARVLLLTADLAKAMGPAFDRVGRQLLLACIPLIHESKKQVRDGVVAVLDAWAGIAPPEKPAAAAVDAVTSTTKATVDGKVTGLSWLTGLVSGGRYTGGDTLQKAVAAGAKDRSKEVREAASALSAALTQQPTQDAAPVAGSHAVPALASSRTEAEPAAKPAARGAPPRAAAGSTRPATPPSAAAADELPSDACLRVDRGKGDRARKARFRAAGFEPPKTDDVEMMQADLAPLASDGLRPLLLSSDFRRHVEAVDVLAAHLQADWPAMHACLDLLLTWLVARICEANTTCLLKALAFLQALFAHLQAQEIVLSDHEAGCIIPCLVEKSGHNQEKVRTLHGELLAAACDIYPVPRMIDAIDLGLGSKSNRTRIVCTDALAAILKLHGRGVFKQTRKQPFHHIAQLVSERDGATRQAVLRALEALYVSEGPDEAWACIGSMNAQQRSLIQERFKYVDRQAQRFGAKDTASGDGAMLAKKAPEAAPSSRAPSAPASAMSSPRRTGDELLLTSRMGSYESSFRSDVNGAPAYANGHGTSVPPPYNVNTPPHLRARPEAAGAGVPTPMPTAPSIQLTGEWLMGAPSPLPPSAPLPLPSRSEADFAACWRAAVEQVCGDDLQEAIMGMKVVCFELDGLLREMLGQPLSSAKASLLASTADQLASHLTFLLGETFQLALEDAARYGGVAAQTQGQGYRGAKYTLSALMHLFSLPPMARAISATALQPLAGALLLQLLDARTRLIGENEHMQKGVNVLMQRLVSQADQTVCCRVLLALLLEPPEGVEALDAELERKKFLDLVVKCLIRMTKRISDSPPHLITQELRVEELLWGVHDFLDTLGIDEVRARGQKDDKPLRMVKTLVFELCKALGPEMRQYMGTIPYDTEPQPILHAYVDLNLKILSEHSMIGQRPGSSPRDGHQQNGNLMSSPRITSRNSLTPSISPRSSTASQGAYPSPVQSARSNLSSPSRPDAQQWSASPPLEPQAEGEVALLQQELVEVLRRLREGQLQDEAFEHLAEFCDRHPGIDPFTALASVSLSREFHIFAHEQLERVQRERHERAMRAARRGLAQASRTPPSDADAISIPDVPTPDAGRPPLPPTSGAAVAQHQEELLDSYSTYRDAERKRRSGSHGDTTTSPRDDHEMMQQ